MTELCLVGGGNMATALAGGLVSQGFPARQLYCAEPLAAARERILAAAPGMRVSADNAEALENAGLVVLAVKPQVLETVLRDAAALLRRREPLLISIVAGVRLATMEEWLGAPLPMVRCMPNTAALVHCSASVLFANARVSAAQKEEARRILAAVGRTWWAETEEQLDAVTAISGSGPAYFFLLMESLQEAARELGLPAELGTALSVQTALGAARMADESGVGVRELRQRVTSPGGTTERALQVLEERGLEAAFLEAARAAAERSRELAAGTQAG